MRSIRPLNTLLFTGITSQDGSYLAELLLEKGYVVAEMVAADREEARKEAIWRLKGFNVVGSMENPPTNPEAVAAACQPG